MPFSDESQNLRIELDIKNCRFSPAELEKMERALDPLREPVRKRAGRWIERYPEFEIQLGAAFTIDDLVEEVFLNAFEWYDDRPRAVRLGEWLEQLIDPAVKTLLKDPDAEQENIDLVRTWRESADEQQRADED